MLKSVQFFLTEVTYEGKSIGDDIRLDIEVLDKLFRLDKKIGLGEKVKIDREIGRFTTDQKSFKTDIKLVIVEKDALFNDTGTVSKTVTVNAEVSKPHHFDFKIPVKEIRSYIGKRWGKSTAIFSVTLEARVTDAKQYVPDQNDGWLLAVLEENNLRVEMPAFLKVSASQKTAKREYFTILEGPYRGKRASVALQKDGSSQFIIDVKHEPAAQAVYSISKKILSLNGKIYKTTDYPEAPWKKGIYDIEIPDYAHRGGAFYPEAKRAKTWFKVGHSGERYLHTGGRSLGCITVTEKKRWPELYTALIKARKGDFMSIGTLEIVD